MASLRAKVAQLQAKERKSTTRELHEPWTLDGDLVDDYNAVQQRHDDLVKQFEGELSKLRDEAARQRNAQVAADEDDEDARFGGPDTAEIDRWEADETAGINQRRAAMLAPLDAELARLKAAIEESTVFLCFRAIPSARYDELLSGVASDSTRSSSQAAVLAAFQTELAKASFVGVESDGALDRDQSWAALKELTDAEDDDGNPLMTAGFVDYVETKVLALNRRVNTAPFSLTPSKATATH